MDNNFFPSLPDTSNEVLLGLKRSLNNSGPTSQRLSNSPNISLSNSTNSQAAANLTRLFQYPSTLSIPSIYQQNPNIFTTAQLNQLNQFNQLNKQQQQLNLPIDKQDYLNSVLNSQNTLNELNRDNQLQSNIHNNLQNNLQNSLQLNSLQHRRRPSLLQSTALSTDLGFQHQYLPYLNERFREGLREGFNSNLLTNRQKATILPQNYPSSLINQSNNGQNITSSLNNLNQSITAQFNPLNSQIQLNQQLAQSTPPLNFLQQQQSNYLDNETNNLISQNKRPRLQPPPPLLIEVKKEPAYTPQVEAISPTPNEDTRPEGSPTKTTKDDILGQISQIDREITQTDNQISRLKKKQQELEALTNKTSGKSSDLNEYLESKQQSITQIIYFENRKKSQDSRQLLENLGPKIILPIYNQPSDTKVYHQNKEKFTKFKPLLQQHFRRKLERKQKREKFLTETYDRLMQEWLNKLESKDTNPIKKNKDTKLRDFFEKQFLELKKQREDKERLSRAGQRVRSDADIEDIMDGIQEQELEDKKIRAYAVIPPILYDENERIYRFKTNNCKIDDPVSVYKELTYLNVWTTAEKEIFKEKFLQSPKNFGLIANFLERKSVMDCVQYYYSSKKRENYKNLLRKNAKKRTRAIAKQQAAQQAAQQEQAQQQLQRSLALQARNLAKQQLELEKENLLKTNTEDNKDDLNKIKQINQSTQKIKEEEDDDNCLKCANCLKKIELNSKVYTINKTNCFLYGLNVEDVKRNSRLCKKCKNEFGRGECPVPSCKAIKKSNRRLKTLPREWFELTPENRYTFSAELNFPLDCKRCCTRCWIRLVRKSMNYNSSFKNTTLKKYLNCVWSDSEIDKLKNAIRDNGRDWELISTNYVGSKTAKQCRQFYFYFKYNLNLNELMKYRTLQTDDFDSDTCWKEMESDNESSEDEYLIEHKPIDRILQDPTLDRLQDCKKLSSSQISLKSDSSATMSADELSQSNLADLMDSRITPPSRSSSVLPSHLNNASTNDKLRPLSTDNLDIDSKLKTNQKYMIGGTKQKSALNQKPGQLPALFKYLISPNAPTNHLQSSSNQQSKQMQRQDSPNQTTGLNLNQQSSASNLISSSITPSITPTIQSNLNQAASQPFSTATGPTSVSNQQPPSNLSQQQQQQAKVKATCVKDLIYHTIDITFQADKGGPTSKQQLEQVQQQQQQLKDKPKQSASQPNLPSNLPLYFAQPDIKRELNPLIRSQTADSSSLQHIISPYNIQGLNLLPIQINELIENEAQDLSKKSGGNKKDLQTSDEYIPKNYSLPKPSVKNEFSNLPFQSNSMPPPAHSNQTTLSRTSTPGLDLQNLGQFTQEQIQNFYLNRHTDSPRSNLIKNQQGMFSTTERITPNHLLNNAASPTPISNMNRLTTSTSTNSKANQQQQSKLASASGPPPLITNSNLSKLPNNQLNKSGSITLGTPIHQQLNQTALDINALQQQYLINSLNLNNLNAKERENAIGSITLGTPLYRRNMPKLNTTTTSSTTNPALNLGSANFLSGQPNTPFNFPTPANLKAESQMSSSQNQLMIDFNTSQQMQKQQQTTGSTSSRVNANISNLTDTNKERNSPLVMNRLNQFTSPAAYSQLQLNAANAYNSGNINTIFDAQKLAAELNNLNKSQSPLLIDSRTQKGHSNSPKISESPNSRQNIIQHSTANYHSPIQLLSGKNTPSSVIQQASQQQLASIAANKSMLPLYQQPIDAFQTLVNTAAAQQSIPTSCETNLNKKLTEEDEKNFFNHSALKFARNPFTKEQFEKEIKSQELIKKKQQQNEQNKNERKTPSTLPSNFDLDNEAQKIFSNSFQKDPTNRSHMYTTANLIDAIICNSINQSDSTAKSMQSSINKNSSKDDLLNFINQNSNKSQQQQQQQQQQQSIPSYTSTNYLDSQLKNFLIDNVNQSMNNPLSHLMNDRNLMLAAAAASKQQDELNESQSWKLRKALEQKEAQLKESSTSKVDLEPISPPTTPSKELTGTNKQQNDPTNFQKFVQNRIAQAMNLDQQQQKSKSSDKETDLSSKKEMDLSDKKEKLNLENLNQDKLPQIGLEKIKSLSELKAQKQQKTASKDDKQLVD